MNDLDLHARVRQIGTRADITHDIHSTGGFNVKITTLSKNVVLIKYSGGAAEPQMHELLNYRRPVGVRYELHRRSDFNVVSFLWGTLVGFIIAIIVGFSM